MLCSLQVVLLSNTWISNNLVVHVKACPSAHIESLLSVDTKLYLKRLQELSTLPFFTPLLLSVLVYATRTLY